MRGAAFGSGETMIPVFSYWSGRPTWMERLSVASIVATGHDITVFSYEPSELAGYGLGCRIADARDVLDDPQLDHLRSTMPAHFSDLLRIEGITKGLGTWIDLDIVMLRPLPEEEHLFGWENSKMICNAVLRLPEGRLLDDYAGFCRKRPITRNLPWAPLRKRISRGVKIAVNPLRGKKQPQPPYGPAALTHYVHKHGLAGIAKRESVFYPLMPNPDSMKNVHIAEVIESTIRPETVCVHLWRSLYRSVHGSVTPTSGWIRQRMSELDVLAPA